MKRSAAEILREYGPFPGVDRVNGVTYDGRHVWFASGDKLNALDPASGRTLRSIDVAAHAGTAFDGQNLFQIAEDRIQKIDPKTGGVLATIPAPGGGGDSGLAWAEGTLWVGQHRGRKIHQVDPQTGAILRTIESKRVVTGVTWTDGELWHGTWEGAESDLRRVDPQTGEVLERIEMPPGVGVSGLESDGGDQFFCGGGGSGKVRAVRRPTRDSVAGQRLRDHSRLHEQVVEAALAGRKPVRLTIAWINGCSRSSPRGRRQRLPDGLGTAALPPRSPPAGRFARDGTRTVLVEGRLRRSVPAPASLLSCRPDPAGSRCPAV
jgi:hypothetical protein